jgi:hypothetical protein
MNFDKRNLGKRDFFVYQSGNCLNGYFERLRISVVHSIYQYDINNPSDNSVWYFEFIENCPWFYNGNLLTIPETRIICNGDLQDIYQTRYFPPSNMKDITALLELEKTTNARLLEYAAENRKVLKRE